MPDDGPVSVKMQIVLSLLFPATFWAFYRIRKLRLYILCVIVPAAIISTGILALAISSETVDTFGLETEIGQSMQQEQARAEDFSPVPYVGADIGMSMGFLALGAYLAMRWSREWNRRQF